MISVILTCLNEGPHLEACLQSLGDFSGLEVLVVDGGSREPVAPRLARFSPLTLLQSPPGRARQFNLGAALAQGEVLLFLHSDSLLPTGWREEVNRILGNPNNVAGAFAFKTDLLHPQMARIERWANRRSRWLQLPYGDQGLFVAKATFEGLGGFAPLPLMEDYELVLRLKKRGRIETSPLALVTSGRRWLAQGFWAASWTNFKIIFLYHLGISPDRLRKIYHSKGPQKAVDKQNQPG